MALFDAFANRKKLKITKPIRLIELFAGVGTQAMALRDLGVDFERYRVCEIDKYAMQSYNAIHGTAFVASDICDWHGDDLGIIDTDKYCYILTYSFPCTNISVAGLQKGMDKSSNTPSSLVWQVTRLLTETKELPQILVMENVTQIHSKKFIDDFNNLIEFLSGLGYTNTYTDLNAIDFLIPQTRNRCFMVSTLNELAYEFPKPVELTTKLHNYLEPFVDISHYYLKETAKELTDYIASQGSTFIENTSDYNRMYMLKIRNFNQQAVVNDEFGLCRTLLCVNGSNKPKLLQKYKIDSDSLIVDMVGNVIAKPDTFEHFNDFIYMVDGATYLLLVRYVTPLECWRLMGYSDDDYNKAKNTGLSNYQLYAQAINGIVKDVLMAIFKQMF